MEKIANFFITNSKLTIVLSIGLFIFGYNGLKVMNAESFPQVSMATAMVTTFYDGASAQDIETKITKPIEDEIRSVNGLKDVRSTSQSGLSTITIRVDMDDPKVDVKEAMEEIQLAIDRVNNLPGDLREKPSFVEMKSDEFPVFEIAIIGDNSNRSRDKISDLLKEEFEDNSSVKDVRLVGFQDRVFYIDLDKKKLERFHIAIEDILIKVRSRNKNTPGGALKTSLQQTLVRVEGKVESVTDLEKLVIRSNFSGKTVRLGDVAHVRDSAEELQVIPAYNSNNATLVIVNKKSGADTIKMVKALQTKLDQFAQRYPQYKFNVYNSEGVKVKNRVDVLASNAVTGLVLVIIFLFIFLPGRIGLVASLSLPLAMMGTMGFMPTFGMNIDAITVLALVIALGMMVDNSVVISENFTRLRLDGLDGFQAASQSIKSLWLPITATAFTTISAFLPMLVTKGVMGQFIKWIPIVVTIALLLSLFESFIFLPMRLVWAGKNIKNNSKKKGDWFTKFEMKFESFMRQIVRGRYLVLLVFLFVIGFSFYMMVGANKFILFPADQTEAYIARVEMPKGTRVEQTSIELKRIANEVKEVLKEDAKHIVARAGTAQMGPNDPKARDGNNVGMLSIYVSEYAKNNINYLEILERLKKVSKGNTQSLSFEELVNGPPVGNAVEATFRSNSDENLNAITSQIAAELSKINGIENISTNDILGDDEIFVNIDYEKSARLNVSADQIGSVLRTSISGNRVSDVILENKEVDLMIRLNENQRSTISDLEGIKIKDPRGNLIPLKNIVNFKKDNGSPHIKRFDFKKSKTLTADVDEKLITSIKANAKLQEIYNKLQEKFPDVSLVFGGAQESTNESMTSLFSALQLSLIGIFALLVFLFKSYLRPLIIMTTIPLGLLGFSVAFFLHGRPVSFLAMIGLIGLGGIIVNSGIVLISFIDEMKEEGKLDLQTILARASRVRLRAVFVTSLTTISGLLPTAYGIGGNDALLIPMTLAMAWGLTSGTVLTLIWVPAAYAILEDFNSFISRIFSSYFKTQKVINE